MADLIEELDAWLDEHWDPDLTVAQWWELLGTSGWAHPALPAEAYGKGVSRTDALAVSALGARERRAVGPPGHPTAPDGVSRSRGR